MYILTQVFITELFNVLLISSGFGFGLFNLFGLSISPAGQPRIRLTYIFSDQNGETNRSYDEQELHRTMSNSGCLSFTINYEGIITDIEYNIKNDIISGSNSYSMVSFELMKIEGKAGFIYVGTIVKTDLEDEVFNIKISGMLPDDAEYQELSYVTVPEY